jgi:predicted DNA-binding transcriptional regulator YafY
LSATPFCPKLTKIQRQVMLMRRAERLFRLVNEMRARGISRADDLAGSFEVSVRTIYRDIAHLQASGLPIEGEAGIGYLLRPGFDLPRVTFTYAQLDALAVGLSFAESLDDPALAAAAREVRAKIQAGMPQPEARKLADAPYFSLRRSTGAPDYAGVLREAIRKRQIVTLIYADGEQRQSDRRVRPLAIWNLTDGWMFSGWCELRQDFRTFRFDRIAQLTVTDERFADDPAKGLRAFMTTESCEQPATP